MIKCMIIDDEQHAIDVLSAYVSKVPFLELLATSNHPLEAMEILKSEPVELLFLDIQMPDITGIQLIELLNNDLKVILTTAYSEYAIKSYELDVVDYLLKPIRFERFLKAVNKLNVDKNVNASESTTSVGSDFLTVKTEQKGKLLKINYQDIVYVEGMKNYLKIHMHDDDLMALITMKSMEESLPKHTFFRIHKSFIVSFRHVVGIEGNMVLIREGDAKLKLPLGATYQESFKAIFQEKLLGR